MQARLLHDQLPAAGLGEGPYWHDSENRLYWVDISGKVIHRCDVNGDRHETCNTPAMVGFAVPDENGKLVAGLEDGIYRLDFSTGAAENLVRLQEHAHNRFNDGKCDRRGRLWAGTMNEREHAKPFGALYRYDKTGLYEREKNVCISNGLGWSPDNKTMYYADTIGRVIWRYAYDIDTGQAGDRTVFAEFTGKSRPDGLCVDSQGRVFSAQWPGWGIEIFTPDGKQDGRTDLPVPQVSSCAFGGPQLKTLFITTAAIGLDKEQLEEAPLSGRIFAVDMDVAGLPETPFKG